MYQITTPRCPGPFSFEFILPESLHHLGLIRDYVYIPIQTCTAEWHTKQRVSHSQPFCLDWLP